MKPHLPLLVLPVLLVAACGASETEPNEPDPTEAVVPAAKAEAPKTPDFVAVISSKKSETIAAAFDSKVLKIDIRNGQPVRTGDVIAELDDTELRAKLDEAKGQLQRAKGAAARAGTAYA